MSIRGKTAVVGIAEIETFDNKGQWSPTGLASLAAQNAVKDAGLTLRDIDGLFTTSSYNAMPSLTTSEYLGIRPRFVDTTALGGCSFIAHLGHAAAAIEAGLCEVALIVYGSTQRSDRGALVSNADWLAYEQPYGLLHPIGSFGMIAQRHFADFGTTSEQLAHTAVAAREWAQLNPQAPYTEPLTVDDVLNSPTIASPLHKLDCCLVTDGAAAVVLTSAAKARDLRAQPIYLLGVGEAQNHRNISQMPDLTRTEAGTSAQRALTMANAKLGDIDTAHVYDAFTISLLILLEDLGFCPKGEGGPFVADGNIAPGGAVALNTNGGGLSFCHPGMLGLFLLTEAVRQLRGDAEQRQIQGATTSLVHGMGLTLAAHATAILGTSA